MKIAVLLTCFNRKEKTLSCLAGLYESQRVYYERNSSPIELEVFLTDDGCTDGTAQAVKASFAGKSADRGQLYPHSDENAAGHLCGTVCGSGVQRLQ